MKYKLHNLQRQLLKKIITKIEDNLDKNNDEWSRPNLKSWEDTEERDFYFSTKAETYDECIDILNKFYEEKE